MFFEARFMNVGSIFSDAFGYTGKMFTGLNSGGQTF